MRRQMPLNLLLLYWQEIIQGNQMSKLPLDLSKFKKVGSTKSATILEHPAGHRIQIAHKALSPEMKADLDKLDTVKKYAEGGEPQSDNQDSSTDTSNSTSTQPATQQAPVV